MERHISFLLSFHKKYRYFSCSPENNAVIGGYVNAEKLGEGIEYESLLKSFIGSRFVPVQKVDFSLKSAQVFVSIRFYLNFLCSATFF